MNFEQINDSNEITSSFKFKVSHHPLIYRFEKFYDDFSEVLRKNLPLNAPRAVSQTITPPLQSTVPPDPQYSSSSTTSTSSKESKPEHHARDAAYSYLWATVKSMGDQLEKFTWYCGGDVQLKPTFLNSVIWLTIVLNKR
jgi:hypothetical protein